METALISIITRIIGIALGFFIAKYLAKKKASSIIENANLKAKTIVKDGEVEAEKIKNQKMLQAKERFIELKSEHEKVIENRNRKVERAENRIKQIGRASCRERVKT